MWCADDSVMSHASLRDLTMAPRVLGAWTEGDVSPLTHEILRGAVPDPEKRPVVHVGG